MNDLPEDFELVKEAANKKELESNYENWLTNPSKDNLGLVIKSAEPIITSAVKNYGGGTDVKSKAKLLTIKALNTYNKNKNTQLSSHIYTQLQPLRREALRSSNVLGVSEKYTQEKAKLYNARNEFVDKYDRDPADSELADMTGISTKKIRFLNGINNGTISEGQITDRATEDDDGSMPGVSKPLPENTWLSYVHHDANPIDQKIIEWKTGFGGNQILPATEIAKRLRLTPAAVSQRAKRISDRIGEGLE